MLACRSLRHGPDLAEETLQHAWLLDDVPAHHLEHFIPAHQRVVGQVDDAHPAPPQLADDLVVRMISQPRRQVIRRWR